MPTRHRLAGIGIGAAAEMHAHALDAIEGATLVAGSCQTESKGHAFAEAFKCSWYDGRTCSARQRFRRRYLPDDQPGEMKLAQDDATRLCKRAVDHGVGTGLVAEQFEISRRRVQQLAKAYRETGEIPQLETPGRRPYADYPDDLEDRILDLRQRPGAGAVVIAHVLRVRDGLSLANNRVHEILQEHDHVTEHPNKQGRRRPWVRFERENAAVTVHMDWYHNKG